MKHGPEVKIFYSDRNRYISSKHSRIASRCNFLDRLQHCYSIIHLVSLLWRHNAQKLSLGESI